MHSTTVFVAVFFIVSNLARLLQVFVYILFNLPQLIDMQPGHVCDMLSHTCDPDQLTKISRINLQKPYADTGASWPVNILLSFIPSNYWKPVTKGNSLR